MTPRLLVTVRPGPVLHVWRDGQEVARLPLEAHAALMTLTADLLRAVREALAEGGDAPQASCAGR